MPMNVQFSLTEADFVMRWVARFGVANARVKKGVGNIIYSSFKLSFILFPDERIGLKFKASISEISTPEVARKFNIVWISGWIFLNEASISFYCTHIYLMHFL